MNILLCKGWEDAIGCRIVHQVAKDYDLTIIYEQGGIKMAKLLWDQVGQKTYETGVDHGVLYLQEDGMYLKGVAWNGLTTITETPSGADDNAFYADNIKYLNIKSAEDYGFTIECYTYPDEWHACNGEKEVAPGVIIAQQTRQNFGMSYRTRYGNDTVGDNYGFKLHLAYGCSASPSDRGYGTVNDSPDPISFSFEVTTTPVVVENYVSETGITDLRPVSLITIDSTKADKEKLEQLMNILYGSEDEDPRLPLPEEVFSILSSSGNELGD